MGADRSRRGRGSRILRAVVVVLGLVVMAWAVANSPFFAIDAIHVRGNVALTSDRVVRLAGVRHGDNLLRLSVDAVTHRLSRSPWVASVGVDRAFPSTLVLRVVERSAVATVETGGSTLAVAADGTVLGLPANGSGRLPSLGAVAEPLDPGDSVRGSSVALRVAAALDPDLRTGVREIRLDRGEVVLRLRRGGRVLYGPATATARKNDALTAVLDWAEGRDIEVAYIDVRAPARPALKPVGEPVGEPPAAPEDASSG